jgi:hypothetical protein
MLSQIVLPGKMVRTTRAPERRSNVTMHRLMTFKAVLKRKRCMAKGAFVGFCVCIYMATIGNQTVF